MNHKRKKSRWQQKGYEGNATRPDRWGRGARQEAARKLFNDAKGYDPHREWVLDWDRLEWPADDHPDERHWKDPEDK